MITPVDVMPEALVQEAMKMFEQESLMHDIKLFMEVGIHMFPWKFKLTQSGRSIIQGTQYRLGSLGPNKITTNYH